jgi:hypothetical protein
MNIEFSGSGHEDGEKGGCEGRKGEEREIRGDKVEREDDVEEGKSRSK